MAIAKMVDLTNKTASLKTADFNLFKTTLENAEAKPTPAAKATVDSAVDQMIARWKNSTQKLLTQATWDELTLLCKKIYYEREANKATVSRGIWQVIKDNFL